MARKEKHWEDDDGRTIADMSQVKRPSLFGNLPGSAYQREEQPEEREEAKKSPPWVDNSLSKQDRHAFFFGTMKASLLCGLPGGIRSVYPDSDASVPLTAERSDPKRGVLQPEDAPFYTHYRKNGRIIMISSMLQYIQKSPDCFHAVENLRQRLLSEGYTQLTA